MVLSWLKRARLSIKGTEALGAKAPAGLEISKSEQSHSARFM